MIPTAGTCASSTSARASQSTLTELSDYQQTLELFTPSVQTTISILQDQFNQGITTDGRLFELYDTDTTRKMWNAAMERNVRSEQVTTNLGGTSKTEGMKTDDPTRGIMKQAGVLVLFVYSEANELSIVFTRRSKHLSSHASEISFPGGRYEEKTDATIVDTAIREACEELHSSEDGTTVQDFRKQLYIFGCTTAIPSLRGIPVTSVLGFYNRSHGSSNDVPITQLWPGNPSEVETVFTWPVTTLMKDDKQSSSSSTLRTSFERTSSNRISPSPRYPTSHGTIWGLTAYILHPILSKLLIPLVERKTNEGILLETKVP
jgi:8-oxo-dGTP pyrophosphatase MutT (NUDIX family)